MGVCSQIPVVCVCLGLDGRGGKLGRGQHVDMSRLAWSSSELLRVVRLSRWAWGTDLCLLVSWFGAE